LGYRYIFVVLLLISAVSRALEQIMRWAREYQSWLPEGMFTWDLRVLSTMDAVHVYMGITLLAFGVAFLFFPREFKPFRLKCWLYVAAFAFLYYQAFNLFYHVIFIQPAYWRWPILIF